MRQQVIAIIDADQQDRQFYKQHCNQSVDLTCSLAVKSLSQFLSYYQATATPDIILFDIQKDYLIIENFEKQIVKLKSVLPDAELVILTNEKREPYIVKSFHAGANGYLLKRIDRVAFNNHLLTIQHRGAAVSTEITRLLVRRLNYEKIYSDNDEWDALSRKQLEVIDHLAQGLNASETATKLNISVDGVRYHIRHIYKKLKVNNKSGLLKKYFAKRFS